MKTRFTLPLCAVLTAAALTVTPNMAQNAPAASPTEHAHHPPATHQPPTTYAEALAEIDEHLEAIAGVIKSRKLGDVHNEAHKILDLSDTLVDLALEPNSGVPSSAVKDIRETAEKLAATFDAIDKAGDSGDEAAVKAALGEMTALHAKLKTFAPTQTQNRPGHSVYFCPMHDEGTKTYDAPGQCPKCGMALKQLTDETFTSTVTTAAARVVAGQRTTLTLKLKNPTGTPVTELQTVHEEVLHLLIVSNDLSWFRHEHPVRHSDGSFTLDYTFPHGGEFALYHDFTPPNVGQQVVRVPLKVDGPVPPEVTLTIDDKAPKLIDGYTIELDTAGPVKTGENTHLSFTISKDAQPVTTLAPYLGAMGHLVVISQDGKEFVHSHPHEPGPDHPTPINGPKVHFEAHFKQPGIYKAWGQFNIGSKEKEVILTAPFTFEVKQGEEPKPSTPNNHNHTH